MNRQVRSRPLTPHESDLLHRHASGKTIHQIAREQGRSISSVRRGVEVARQKARALQLTVPGKWGTAAYTAVENWFTKEYLSAWLRDWKTPRSSQQLSRDFYAQFPELKSDGRVAFMLFMQPFLKRMREVGLLKAEGRSRIHYRLQLDRQSEQFK